MCKPKSKLLSSFLLPFVCFPPKGKQIIHPGQIKVVQEEFSPSPERVTWAADLIAAFEQHQKLGKGAFTFRGSMIDMPLLKQAQNIVALAASVADK
ncbi:hypothetical protein GN956_G13391 [Arapaima gigas]